MMDRSKLSMRWLEIFLLAARTGSIQKTASESGLSASTVSQHLHSLQNSLGVALLDHSKRPMQLTSAGVIFARYVEDGIRLIRRGETELTTGNWAESRDLRFGMVDDFDSEVAPELAQFLATALPKCRFMHYTRPSHAILQLLVENKLDAAVATRPLNDMPGLVEYRLLRDPFVVAVPRKSGFNAEEFLSGKSGLPFLRYSGAQIIGNLIEIHLRRLKLTLPNRFEMESNHSLMGLVAEGSGWAITTPASYFRAKRFHDRVTLLPFPAKGFARNLSLFSTDVFPPGMAEVVASALRRLIARNFTEPVVSKVPWLAHEFMVLGDEEPGPAKTEIED